MTGHKIKPERAAHLDNRLRRFLIPAEKILSDFRPLESEIWTDIGAGTGYFTIPLSPHVRKVYAVDLSEDMLERLRRNLVENHVNDVEVLKSGENSLPLADATADAALLAFVVHELDDPAVFFTELSRIITPGGRICIVEFGKSRSFGPPLDHRLTVAQIDTWARQAGFTAGGSWQWSRRFFGWKYVDLQGLQYRKKK